jgi:hypothetical protein
VIAISQERIEELAREQIAAALPAHTLRRIARNILRRQLGVLTLREAARWLKWKSPEALRRALVRAGVPKVKTSAGILCFTVPELIKFRDDHTVSRKSARRNVLKLEGSAAA